MKNQPFPSAVKSRRRNVSDSPQTSRRRSARLNAIDELLQNIPIDLVMEIFSRLPLKSIARCRCVSKRWASVLRRPDFTELFLIKSSARPRLLFAREEESDVIFFSSPQPTNPDESLSPIATVDHHRMAVPFESVQEVCSYVNGYVCLRDERMSKGMKMFEELVYVICNPTTGKCITLPKMKARKNNLTVKFLGFDPVEKHHKVLTMTWQDDGAVEHQVLTLGGNNGNLQWRMKECGIRHCFPRPESICINGSLYYIVSASSGEYMIVCFDVRSESYSFVKGVKSVMPPATLINYNGKLAVLMSQPDPYVLSGTSTSFEMWILEDPEKHEWSQRIFSLPPMWTDATEGDFLYFVGVTATNEFVIAPRFSSGSFHVYYYNFINESVRRVEIQGMGAFETTFVVQTFLNHVEDVMRM